MNPPIWMMLGYPKVAASKGRHVKEKGASLVKRKCVSYLWFCFKIYLCDTIGFYFYFLIYVSNILGSFICFLEVMNLVHFINTLEVISCKKSS